MTFRRPRALAVQADPNGDGAWMLTVAGGEIYQLASSAYAIWMAALDAHGVQEVISRLVNEQGWNDDEIREPVSLFMSDLVSRGLLVEEGR